MRKIFALMLAIAMVLTMVACGKKADNKADSMVTPELYISTVDGKDTVVDKDGKAVTGYTLDKDGNVVDGSGKLVLAAQQLKALPSKAAESKPASGHQNGMLRRMQSLPMAAILIPAAVPSDPPTPPAEVLAILPVEAVTAPPIPATVAAAPR